MRLVYLTMHPGQRSQTALITLRTFKPKTSWVAAVREAINRQCCLLHVEMEVASNSLEVVVSYQMRKERFNRCHKIQDQALLHRIWMAFWAQTHKQSQIDQEAHLRRYTTINWEQTAPWDQVAALNQGPTRSELEALQEATDKPRKGKSVVVKVQCLLKAIMVPIPFLWKLEMLSIKAEGLRNRIPRAKITTSLPRIRQSNLKTPRMQPMSSTPTISCLETMLLDSNRWSCQVTTSLIKVNTDLSSIRSNQEARVHTTEWNEMNDCQ